MHESHSPFGLPEKVQKIPHPFEIHLWILAVIHIVLPADIGKTLKKADGVEIAAEICHNDVLQMYQLVQILQITVLFPE